jgi:hypothetical protein
MRLWRGFGEISCQDRAIGDFLTLLRTFKTDKRNSAEIKLKKVLNYQGKLPDSALYISVYTNDCFKC